MFLQNIPPMGIYETLYAFLKAFGTYMGESGTHPWSQGFPRTDQLPDGPAMPTTATIKPEHLKYPKAWGLPELRDTLAAYYNTHYGSNLEPENIMVFAGGRPALLAVLLFLEADIRIRIASTEYTPYYDLLKHLDHEVDLIPSGVENNFTPSVDDYVGSDEDGRALIIMSNPCNPTGITRHGAELKQFVQTASAGRVGLLIDEAYELFHHEPVSALAYVDDINQTNLFVAGASTKGFQTPGIRIGWMVAAKHHIEVLSNYSSFGMGGVSHPSQCFALELLQEDRVKQVRKAVPSFYQSQRARYGEAFESLGLKLFSGNGGFYHWCQLPGDLSAEELNQRLFKHGAAILKGTDCDMARLGDQSPLKNFFRFSFGPLAPESFESDIAILKAALHNAG